MGSEYKNEKKYLLYYYILYAANFFIWNFISVFELFASYITMFWFNQSP